MGRWDSECYWISVKQFVKEALKIIWEAISSVWKSISSMWEDQ